MSSDLIFNIMVENSIFCFSEDLRATKKVRILPSNLVGTFSYPLVEALLP